MKLAADSHFLLLHFTDAHKREDVEVARIFMEISTGNPNICGTSSKKCLE